MAVYETEQEQVENLKKWWKENAKASIAGILIGLSLLIAFWIWRDHNSSQAELASIAYQELLGDVQKGDTRAGLAHGTSIVNQFGDTVYAVFAAMAMAKLEMDKGDAKAARPHLEWALKNADDEALQHIARLRLAQALLDANQASEALTLLNVTEQGAFTGAYSEAKGDIYVQLSQQDAARTAYQKALDGLEQDSSAKDAHAEQIAALQMKLDDLGSGQPDAAKTSAVKSSTAKSGAAK